MTSYRRLEKKEDFQNLLETLVARIDLFLAYNRNQLLSTSAEKNKYVLACQVVSFAQEAKADIPSGGSAVDLALYKVYNLAKLACDGESYQSKINKYFQQANEHKSLLAMRKNEPDDKIWYYEIAESEKDSKVDVEIKRVFDPATSRANPHLYEDGKKGQEHSQTQWELWSKFLLGNVYADCGRSTLAKTFDFGAGAGNVYSGVFLTFSTGLNYAERVRIAQLAVECLHNVAFGSLIPDLFYNVRKKAIRAAFAQVMARNTSHNIGSHVLNSLTLSQNININATNDWGTFIGKLVHNFENPPELGLDVFKHLAQFNAYIKARMDYLGDISFGTPVMGVGLSLLDQIADGVRKVPIIWGNISGIEDFKYSIKFYVDNCPLDNNNDLLLEMPNDILGCQAFYNILENIVRNAAKHNSVTAGEKPIEVKILFDKAKSEFPDCKVTVVDGIWQKKSDVEEKVKKLKHLIKTQILDSSNELRSSGLGLLEMMASAAYLRKLSLEDYFSDDAEKVTKLNPPLLTPIVYEDLNDPDGQASLAFEFYLKFNQVALVIAEKEVTFEKDSKDQGIEICSENDVFCEVTLNGQKSWRAKKVFAHQFVVVVGAPKKQKQILEKIMTNRTCFSPRIVALSGSKISQAKIWQKFAKKRKSKRITSVIFGDNLAAPCSVSSGGLVFYDHETKWRAHKKSWSEPLNSAGLARMPGCAGRTIDGYVGFLHSKLNSQSIELAQLSVAYEEKVLVLDERLQKFLTEPGRENAKAALSKLNVDVPDNKDVELSARDLKDKFEKYIENVRQKRTKWDFLVVHYSILERVFASDRAEINNWLVNWAENHGEVVVTSGRGKPQGLPDAVRYVNFTPLWNIFVHAQSKFAIVDLLMQSRRVA